MYEITRDIWANATVPSGLAWEGFLTGLTKGIILIRPSRREVKENVLKEAKRFKVSLVCKISVPENLATGNFLFLRTSLSATICYSQERQFCLRRWGYAGHTGNDTSETPPVGLPYIPYISPMRQQRASWDQYDCRCVRIRRQYGNKALPSSAKNAYVPAG